MSRRDCIVALVLGAGACTEPNPYANQESSTGSTGLVSTSSSSTSAAPESTSTSTSTGEPATTSSTTLVGTESTSSTTGATHATSESTDGSSSTTAEPVVCDVDTHACVPAAPFGWTGPVAIIIDDPEVAAPDCDGAFDTPSMEAFTDLVASPAACDCTCAESVNATCGSVTVYRDDDSNCTTAPLHTWTLVGTACTNVVDHNSDRWYRALCNVSGGTCAPTPSVTVPDAAFATRVTACGASVLDSAGCGETEWCLERPSPQFEARQCVWQPGDLECPADWGLREVFHESFSDNRGCTACTCGTASGSCAGGSVTFLGFGDCGAAPASTSISIGAASCVQPNFTLGGSVARRSATAPSPVDPTCAPSNPTSSGSAQPTSPVTVCCRADL